MRTARAAAIPIIAVDFGYSEVPMATLKPDRGVHKPDPEMLRQTIWRAGGESKRLIGPFTELPAAIAEVKEQGLAKVGRVSPATVTPGGS